MTDLPSIICGGLVVTAVQMWSDVRRRRWHHALASFIAGAGGAAIACLLVWLAGRLL